METLPARQMPVQTFEHVQKVGEVLAKSGMFGCKNPEQGLVLALTCQMEGMTPLQFRQRYHLIDGEPSMKADAMLAEFNARGGKHRILKRTSEEASVELSKNGYAARFSFTFDEAKQEPFPYKTDGKTLKHNWKTPRARMQMLWARVVSDAVRAVDPGVNQGTYTPEELRDSHPVNAAPPTPPADKPIEKAEPPPEIIEAEVVSETPEADPLADDFSVIPVGKMKGRRIADLNDKQLASVIKYGKRTKGVTDDHIAVAKTEQERREAEAKAEAAK